MKNYFYANTTWNVTVALLDMFNDIRVDRFDTSGNVVDSIDVPITFGPVEKTQQTRTEDRDDVGTRYYLALPRMALVPNGMVHNADRAYGSNEERFWLDEALELSGVNSVFSDYQPVPYDQIFTLFIRTDSMEDFSQIIENILPYFNPKNMLRVKEFSFLNVERDLPVGLGSVNLEFSDELDDSNMREINGSLDLTVEGWAYKPTTSAALVKVINTKYFIGANQGYTSAGVPVTPTSADVSTSADFYQVDGWQTSGFPTSALPAPSTYNTSGYNPGSNVWFTHSNTFSGDG